MQFHPIILRLSYVNSPASDVSVGWLLQCVLFLDGLYSTRCASSWGVLPHTRSLQGYHILDNIGLKKALTLNVHSTRAEEAAM